MTTEPLYRPVTPDRHMQLRWQKYTSFSFARRHSVLPIFAGEVVFAARAFAIAFVLQGEAMAPVIVLGLEPGKCLYVAPDGTWLGDYTPAALRSYPFAEAAMPDGRPVLCVDESGGLQGNLQGELSGEPFFNEDGTLSAATQSVRDFLQQVSALRSAILAASSALQAGGVLQPWPAKVRIGADEVSVEGLFCVDEKSMNVLADDAFLALRRTGAISLAYMQLISMQNLQRLGGLARAESERNLSTPEIAHSGVREMDDFFKGDTLRF